MSQVRTFAAQEQDWQTFLALAAREGWRVPLNEISFHRHPGNSLAYALRRDEETIGFVTAVPHHRSGWIGNLLIKTDERGQGLGARLFDTAIDGLKKYGIQAIWLTASSQGEALYKRREFHSRARVSRWVRNSGGDGKELKHSIRPQLGNSADRAVWQEVRGNLLLHLAVGNPWLKKEGSVALLQREKDLQIIGPWLKLEDERASGALLEVMIAIAAPGVELVIDTIDRPETRRSLLLADFICVGETQLMAAGPAQNICLDRLCALASLGSIG